MYNCIKLSWPKLSDSAHERILNGFVSHHNSVTQVRKVGNEYKHVPAGENFMKSTGYYHLMHWDDQIEFNKKILEPHNINYDNLKHLTIQQSINELRPHVDIARKLTVIYVVDGSADTVFYATDNNASIGVYSKSALTEIQRFNLELHTWYAFNNSVIHSVDNCQKNARTSLTLNVSGIGLFKDYIDMVNNIENSNILFK